MKVGLRSGLGWGVIFLWKRSEKDDIIINIDNIEIVIRKGEII